MRLAASLLGLALACAACATVPDRAYFPPPGREETRLLAGVLYRVASAAGDDPARYSFALVGTRDVSAFTAEDATFYFSEGLAHQPPPVVDALVAHEVAHELLGHRGQRRALSLGLSAGFTVLGVAVPGASLLDLVVNPLIIRAYTRDQEIAADLKAADLLGLMAYPTPRRTLADALRAATKVNGPPPGGWLATEPALEERLAALEPLEPLSELAGRPTTPTRR
ncbi:MAG TPA: M48 family metalloprotease [Methylomirabilota bacterium]|nr:M48 family metalloprotease [Methylomirabilota bacterium]